MLLKLKTVKELKTGTRNLMFLLLMFFLMFHGETELHYNQNTRSLETDMVVEVKGVQQVMVIEENETGGVYQNIMFHMFIFFISSTVYLVLSVLELKLIDEEGFNH